MFVPPKLPHEEEKEMPPGFVSQVDPATGRTYYVNTTTGISQWWAPLPPSLPFSPPPLPLPTLPPPSTENDFFAGEMKPMGINTNFQPVHNDGQPKENFLLLLFKGRQYRTLYCLGWCAFSVLTYHGINSMCSLFSVNSMFSVASINSVFSVGSVNR